MYTDWVLKFKVNRPIENVDAKKLDQHLSTQNEPNERLALSKFNSTYIEFVDRRFRLRGAPATNLMICLFLLSIFVFLIGVGFVDGKFDWFSFFLLVPTGLVLAIFTWTKMLGMEFFSYVYRPIRFNRKNQTIYVFRGEGGTIKLPWEQAYFHIGEGLRQKFLLDLRCHILDGNIIKDTFAVGHYFDREEPILEMWEFIRRYMEEGPEAVKPPFIGLSVEPTLKNCYIWVTASMGLASPVMRVILFPLVAISVLTRYLALKSSRRPKFPPEIEVECVIDPNDPHSLPSPPYISSGYNDDAAFKEAMKKHAARKR